MAFLLRLSNPNSRPQESHDGTNCESCDPINNWCCQFQLNSLIQVIQKISVLSYCLINNYLVLDSLTCYWSLFFPSYSLLAAIILCTLEITTSLYNVLISGSIKQREAFLFYCLIHDHQHVLIFFLANNLSPSFLQTQPKQNRLFSRSET